MNVLEIDESINDIQIALGFTVQNVYYYDKTLVLSLWQNHVCYWLVMCLDFGHQSIFLIPEQKIKLKNDKKPILIFAQTHLKQLFFTDISRSEDLGRKIQMLFTAPENEDVTIDVILIPTSMNISIYKGNKKIHLFKPKDLPEFKPQDLSSIKLKPLDLFKQSWLDEIGGKNNIVKSSKKEHTLSLEIEKKSKAIKKVESDLAKKMNDDSYQFAMLLQKNAVEAKEKYPDLFDTKKSIHKLKDEYFEKHKALNQKILRSQERLKLLNDELKVLKSMTESDWVQSQKNNINRQSSQFKNETSLKVRKLEVANDLVAYYGKSAADNLKLLRAAKAWHYWLHIKDSPSSHMIIFRDKNRELKDSEVYKSLEWFLKESLGVKSSEPPQVFEVLITECRFVRPIKGDKIGRVNYSQEKVIRFKF